jgi:hypothetical protein
MGAKVDRSAMRVASSPTLRIAAGLLLAVLLSVVGLQVVRRLNSHGPMAQLKRAEGSSCLIQSRQTTPVYIDRPKTSPALSSRKGNAPSEPVHLAKKSSIPIVSRDRVVGLLPAPDFAWNTPTSKRGTIDSL